MSPRGWLNVALAASAMLATLPGRTQGLGLVTEPLLASFPELSRTQYANINLVATLLGALFCFPVGWCLDRLGIGRTLAAVTAGLGFVVLWMARTESVAVLAVAIFLTRGLGQSALSVASITLLGRSFPNPVVVAPAVYSILVGVSFGMTFRVVGAAVRTEGWQAAWTTLGWNVLIAAAVFALLARPAPVVHSSADETAAGNTLSQALGSWTFWMFALAASLYGFTASGLGLWHQAILAERGFSDAVYHEVLFRSFMAGLGAQTICMAVGQLISYRWLTVVALTVYASAVGLLPWATSRVHIDLYALAMGSAGGAMTFVFFGVWRSAFGARELGRITGAAQLGTVLASAVGPVWFAQLNARHGSYKYALWIVAGVAALLATALAVSRDPPSTNANLEPERNES